MTRLPTPLAVAVHEAGHAAIRLDTPGPPLIRSMTLDRSRQNELGRVSVTSFWLSGTHDQEPADEATLADWRDRAERDIVCYLAGPISELRWRKLSRGAIAVEGDRYAEQCLRLSNLPGTDLERTATRLRWLEPADEKAAFLQRWDEAEERVAKLFPRIVSLGRLLHSAGILFPREIDEEWARSGAMVRPRR